MNRTAAVCVVLAALALLSRGAAADDDVFRARRPVALRIDKERSPTQRTVILALVGSAAVFAAVGVGFTIDSKHKADRVSAPGGHTGTVWTQDLEDTRKSGMRSRAIAIAGFGLGAASLIAAGIAFMVTDPGTELVPYRRSQKVAPRPSAYVIPVLEGGVVAGAGWRF